MRHFKQVVLSAATGLSALLFCAHPASAATAADSAPRSDVFQLIAKTTDANWVDVDGSGGTSAGDELVVSGDLFRGSTQVGTFGEVCTMTRVAANDEADLLCAVDLLLSQGQLTLQGRFTITSAGPGDIDLAITGGTGGYRTARGTVHADNISDTETQVTIHLIR